MDFLKKLLENSNRVTPHIGFHYELCFWGLGADTSFQEASGLSMEIEYEEITEGGLFHKHRVPKYSKFSPLVLKRGIANPNSILTKWCQNTIGNDNRDVEPMDFKLNLKDESDGIIQTWDFVHAYPVKWSVADLKAETSGFAIENLEFVYQYFTVS